jgi:hypothetical protein
MHPGKATATARSAAIFRRCGTAGGRRVGGGWAAGRRRRNRARGGRQSARDLPRERTPRLHADRRAQTAGRRRATPRIAVRRWPDGRRTKRPCALRSALHHHAQRTWNARGPPARWGDGSLIHRSGTSSAGKAAAGGLRAGATARSSTAAATSALGLPTNPGTAPRQALPPGARLRVRCSPPPLGGSTDAPAVQAFAPDGNPRTGSAHASRDADS